MPNAKCQIPTNNSYAVVCGYCFFLEGKEQQTYSLAAVLFNCTSTLPVVPVFISWFCISSVS